jgi:hypothetical protein
MRRLRDSIILPSSRAIMILISSGSAVSLPMSGGRDGLDFVGPQADERDWAEKRNDKDEE